MTNPLQQILEAVDNVRQANRFETMANVDVINRLTMNERQQHNMNRMDAQVDAHMRKQHGECYETPDLPDMGDHRINSPTINIGVEAAKALLDSAANTNASAAGSPASDPQPKDTAKPSPAGSRVGDMLKTAALVGATSIGTAGMVSYLSNDADTDTRNTYQIEAVPFDPSIDPNE